MRGAAVRCCADQGDAFCFVFPLNGRYGRDWLFLLLLAGVGFLRSGRGEKILLPLV